MVGMTTLPHVDVLLAQVLLPVLHMGALHGYEKALVLALAFGPFLILAVVVSVLRRRDIAEEQREGAPGHEREQERRQPRRT